MPQTPRHPVERDTKPVDRPTAETQTSNPSKSRDYVAMSEKNDKKKKSWLLMIRWPVYFALGMAMAFILYRSFGVYQIAFRNMGLGAIEKTCDVLTNAPFVGWLVFAGCANVARFLIGFLALFSLAACTILQSLVTLSYFSQGGIAGIVTQLRANLKGAKPLSHETSDTPEIKTLVERHNSISEKAFMKLLILSIVGFVAEAIIVFIARGAGANLWTVFVDTFGFEVLLLIMLFFGSVFQGDPNKDVYEYRSRA